MPDSPNGWPGVPNTWPEAPYYAPDDPRPDPDARTQTWTGGPMDVAVFDTQTSIVQFEVPDDFPESPSQAQQAPRVRTQNHEDWGFWE